MDATLPLRGELRSPRSLRLSHDDARAELVKATMEGGRIATAARRLAQVCLPHFDEEEKSVFPALGLLPELMQGMVRPEMVRVLPLIADFSAKHNALHSQHQSIRSAIDSLLVASHRERNSEVAEFAHNMAAHERIEDEVIYPTLIMIGMYLREKLAT